MINILTEKSMQLTSYTQHLVRKQTDYSNRLAEILRSGTASLVKVFIKVGYTLNITSGRGKNTVTVPKPMQKTVVVSEDNLIGKGNAFPATFNVTDTTVQQLLAGDYNSQTNITSYFSTNNPKPFYIQVTNIPTVWAVQAVQQSLPAGAFNITAVPVFTIDCLDKSKNGFVTQQPRYTDGDWFEVVFSFAATAYLLEGFASATTINRMLQYFLVKTGGILANKQVRMSYDVVGDKENYKRIFNGDAKSNTAALTSPDNVDFVVFDLKLGKLKTDEITDWFKNPDIGYLNTMIQKSQAMILKLPMFYKAYARLQRTMVNKLVDTVRVETFNTAADTEQTKKTDVGVNISFLSKDPLTGRWTDSQGQQTLRVSLKDDSSQVESGSPYELNTRLNDIFRLGLTPASVSRATEKQLELFASKVIPALDGKVFPQAETQNFLRRVAYRAIEQDDIPVLIKTNTKTVSPGWLEFLFKRATRMTFNVSGKQTLAAQVDFGSVEVDRGAGLQLVSDFQPVINFRARTEGTTQRISVDMLANSALYVPINWTDQQEVDHSYDKYLRILSQLIGEKTDLGDYLETELINLTAGDLVAASSKKPLKKDLESFNLARQRALVKVFTRISSLLDVFRSLVTHTSEALVSDGTVTQTGLKNITTSLFLLEQLLYKLVTNSQVFKSTLIKQLAQQTGSIEVLLLSLVDPIQTAAKNLDSAEKTKQGTIFKAYANVLRSFANSISSAKLRSDSYPNG